MAKRVSTIYGDALFRLAVEENSLMSIMDEAEILKQIFVENKELREILNSPKISRQEKLAFLGTIFKGKCSNHMMKFLFHVIEKGRQEQIVEIFVSFIAKAKEAKGIGSVWVTSAMEIPEKEKKRIEERLLELTGYHKLEMEFVVDESIIGGLVIRIGDKVIDSSIRTKLWKMKETLAKIQLS